MAGRSMETWQNTHYQRPIGLFGLPLWMKRSDLVIFWTTLTTC